MLRHCATRSKDKREVLRLETEKEKEERIRQEVLRWANPILGSIRDLRKRLRNILRGQGYAVLHAEYAPTSGWSISYDYFINSTLYYSGVYFAYTLALQESLSFELFRDQEDKDELFEAIESVNKALGDFPPPYHCSGQDQQVFNLEQRSMGSVLLCKNDRNRCISYPEFRDQLKSEDYSMIFLPMRKLIESLTPSPEDCRWKRLETVDTALGNLEEVCGRILRLP